MRTAVYRLPTTPTAAVSTGAECALLTKQEVATALGEVTKDPQPMRAQSLLVAHGVTPTPSACGYDAASSPSHLTITVYRSAGASAAQSQQFRQIICGSKEPVPDLGDVAC